MTKLAYYAGPIDDPNLDQGHECRVRRGALRAARRSGFAVFQPQTAYANAAKEPGGVQGVNHAVIERAGLVLVDLVTPGARIGTLIEVGFAVARGVPVVALVARGSPLLYHLALQQPLVTLCKVSGTPGTEEEWAVAWVEALTRFGEPLSVPVDPVLPKLEYWFDQAACGFLRRSDFGPPARTYRGDAGWDLPVARSTVVPPGEFVDVPLAFRLAPPSGHWYRLTGRSSTLRKYQLLVNEGVIDEGYRGPLFAGVWNLGEEEVVLEPNQRIVQVIPHRVVADAVELVEVEELRAGVRGENGFGSTGR